MPSLSNSFLLTSFQAYRARRPKTTYVHPTCNGTGLLQINLEILPACKERSYTEAIMKTNMEPKEIQTSGLSPILSQYDSVGGPQLAESRPPQLFISGLIPAKCVFISQNKLRTSTCSDTIVPAPKGLRYNTFSHLHFPIPLTLLKKHFIFSCVFRKLTRLL